MSKSELPKEGYKICVIPDCQVKHGVPLDHLEWASDYIADKRPDEIICIGDFADMESLSSYDKGKKSFEGRSYHRDISVARYGLSLLCGTYQKLRSVNLPYNPRQVLLLGNHEDRILRAIEEDRVLEGTIHQDDLGYAEYGFDVRPYLSVYTSRGINFAQLWLSCHYTSFQIYLSSTEG